MSGRTEKRRSGRSSRHELLKWTSAVSGLPIDNISQCLNGATFCIITSLACSPNDVDLNQVAFEAVTESQCVQNYVTLQKLAQCARIGGLNHTAGLDSWLKLSKSEDDAFRYLKLLRKSLQYLDYFCCQDIAPEATAPPAPMFDSRLGEGRRSQAVSPIAADPSATSFTPSDFGHRLSSGSLEEELKQQPSFSAECDLFKTILSSTSTPLQSPGSNSIAGSAQRSGSWRLNRKGSSGSTSDSSTISRYDSASPIFLANKLETSCSLASSVEAFMFPLDMKKSNDLVRESLKRKPSLKRYDSSDSDTFSEVEPSLLEAQQIKPQSRKSTKPAGAPSRRFLDSDNIEEMISTLDSIIATVKAEKSFIRPLPSMSVRSEASYRTQETLHPRLSNRRSATV